MKHPASRSGLRAEPARQELPRGRPFTDLDVTVMGDRCEQGTPPGRAPVEPERSAWLPARHGEEPEEPRLLSPVVGRHHLEGGAAPRVAEGVQALLDERGRGKRRAAPEVL